MEKDSTSSEEKDLVEFNSKSSEEKPLLFDVSWEVARKVGGIYTVLTSKAPITVREWSDRYALIGVYNPTTAKREFEPIKPSSLSLQILSNMEKKHGVKVHFGRWLVKGYPRVFLLDLGSSMHRVGEWRYSLMGDAGDKGDIESNEAIVFGFQVAWLLEETCQVAPNRQILAHFHEWLAAVGLIVANRRNLPIATLFTTHATLLGRWLAAGRFDLYKLLHYINPDKEAGDRNIYQRHWIEVGAARGADVFTTVSDITAFEAEHILGRKPDVITPNGLNLTRFIALHEFQNLHLKHKLMINEFVRGHFYGNLTFSIDRTIYFFTSGRREYFNKGVDLFIEALAQLNHLLKQDASEGKAKITVVAFIIMPGNTNSYNVESIRGQSVRRSIREACDSITKNISERLFDEVLTGNIPDVKQLLSQEDLVKLKRTVLSVVQHHSLPPITTHNIVDSDADEILVHIRNCKLLNHADDRVKVIYHPEFLSSSSPILPLDYPDFVRGCHLGVFPSYYEPWGYTPAECTVMGVPSITSNLTGFANYMTRRVSDCEQNGIYVVDRRYKSFEESKHQMANIMWRYCQLSRRERIQLRNRVERLSSMLDWRSLGKSYCNARNVALKKKFGITIPIPEVYKTQQSFH